jgi:flagellin
MSNTDGTATTVTTGNYSTASDANVNTLGFNVRSAASTVETKDISGDLLVLGTDDLTLNGVSIGASTTAATSETAASLAAHLNTYSSSTNVQATASTSVTLNMRTTNPLGVETTIAAAVTELLTVNGVDTAFAVAGTLEDFVTSLNTNLASSGIVATQDEGSIILSSELGATITVNDSAATNVLSVTKADGSAGTYTAGNDATFYGELKLVNTAGGDINFAAANATDAELTTTLAKLGLSLQGEAPATSTAGQAVSVATSASASAAITAIDAALEKVFESRGDLGAFQNRLDHTVSNLRNVSENTSFSKSQIQDTDFATESANLAKAQVLQQAGTAMLAQANASGQSVLSLLK